MKTSQLEKVISGEQTGVDVAALKAARDAGLKTGGAMPFGFLTETGKHPEIAKEFGLHEMMTDYYPSRTVWNVKNSDATFWFGNVGSKGGRLTQRMCDLHSKAFYVMNSMAPELIFKIIRDCSYKTINVAGNRESVSPGIEKRAYKLLLPVFLGGTKTPGKKFCPDYGRPDMKHPMCQQCEIQGDCEEEYQERASQEATYESIRDAP